MQIAELIDPTAMKAGTAFTDKITELIKANGFKTIIETGCYLGDGTTAAINRSLTGDERVYSVECNPKYLDVASKKYPSIEFLLGHSVPKTMLPVSIPYEQYPSDIIIDHPERHRIKRYTDEVRFNVPDEMLNTALIFCYYKPDFVILDSAGYLGFVEFKYLMSLVPDHKFYLALDDTNHIKHYLTMEYVKMHTEKFEIVWTTDEKFGSSIVKVN